MQESTDFKRSKVYNRYIKTGRSLCLDEIVIWGEVLFLIDFSMDFCALYFAYRLLGWKTDLRKLILASVICAATGLICITLPSGIASVSVLTVGWITGTVLTVPPEKRRLRSILYAFILFVFIEAFAGGIMTAIFCKLNQWSGSLGMHFEDSESRRRVFFFAAGIVFFLLTAAHRILSYVKMQKEVTQNGTVAVSWNGHETSVRCMFDSGNLVREPISGKHVMILPIKEASALGIEHDRLSSGMIRGSRLIPVTTLDKRSVLWGILPDSISIRTDDAAYSDIALYIVFSAGTDLAIVPTCIFE